MRRWVDIYCKADPVFYDSLSRCQADPSTFEQTQRPAPNGWRRHEQETWVVLNPEARTMPDQGWKIHLSARLDNADKVLDRAYRYCVEAGIAFKFLRSANVHMAHNQKYAPRAGSGKLVTIYPIGDDELRTVLAELSAELVGEQGPYILSDLRYGDGPLYVRYGGFRLRTCEDGTGEQVPAIATPDGTLVPDRRDPVFSLPDWVSVPEFLRPHLARRNAAVDDFPYRIEKALHFSNGGGVYLGRRAADGTRVVLKEARPHSGIDNAGRDAVARLRHERDALTRLAGMPGIPRLHEHRVVWEHEFLVTEYIDGVTLTEWVVRENPMLALRPEPERITAYRDRALAVMTRVERLVAELHERNTIFGDLHPTNIMIGPDDEVYLVDFELAFPLTRPRPPALGFPGFAAPGKQGRDIDRHAVAATKLWIFFPLVSLLELDPGKLESYVDAASAVFDLPGDYLSTLRRDLTPAPTRRRVERLGGPVDASTAGRSVDWPAVNASIARAILASATPDRPDRLFPGDVEQFMVGGAGFAYGAAGVLWALDAAGQGRYPEHETWLLDAVRATPCERPGFYDGAHGVAFVLDRFGYRDPALRLVEQASTGIDRVRDVSVFGGLSGIALNLLHLAGRTGEQRYRADAIDLAQRVADTLRSGAAAGIDAVDTGTGRRRPGSLGGLLRGWSGPALLFLRCHQDSGDPAYLDLAVRALHRDLDLCRDEGDGTLLVDNGFRLMPYLDVGSAGISLVAAELLRHRDDERLTECLPKLVRGLLPEFVVYPSLFNGRAGIIATLAALARTGALADLELADASRRHLRMLDWHVLGYQGHVAFPGEDLMRLSMDVATGGAGVLLAIASATGSLPGFLPFLDGGAAQA